MLTNLINEGIKFDLDFSVVDTIMMWGYKRMRMYPKTGEIGGV